MKKLLKIVLATTILASLLAGCGEANSTPTEKEENNVNAVESEEPVEITESSETPEAVDIPQEYLDENFPVISDKSALPQLTEIKDDEPVALMKTSMGDISIRLFPEYAPLAVENFQELSASGYYDGLTFHRVINNFMIQGGDPSGDGSGGESYFGQPFEDEFSPYLNHFYGALSMANSGPNTNGSQFFIVDNNEIEDPSFVEQANYAIENSDEMIQISETGQELPISRLFPTVIAEEYVANGGTPHLDGGHTVFGQVYDGMDIVNAISEVEVDETTSMPTEPVTIETIIIGTYNNGEIVTN